MAPENTADGRRPMRGMVRWHVTFHEATGWTLESPDRRGDATNGYLWDGPTRTTDVYACTSLAALKRESPAIVSGASKDAIAMRLTADKNAYQISAVYSYAVGLITVPPDGKVATLNFDEFTVKEHSPATIRNIARQPFRAATTPLRDVLDKNLAYVVVEDGSGEFDTGKPIVNLDQFGIAPLAKLAGEWGFQLRALDFIEVTPETTTEVSRVPEMLRLFAGKKFATTWPMINRDLQIQKELHEGVPQILNYTEDPEIVDWLLHDVIEPTLYQRSFRGRDRDTPLSTRDYLLGRVEEIRSGAQRARLQEILGPVSAPEPAL